MLKERAAMMQKARHFFAERHILELDCPAIVRCAPIDSNIDVISSEERFLHTSPEYAMKRLLSEGLGDCYFLGHVYRQGEIGRLHNPEFMMAEWYRLNYSFEEMIEETCEFLFLFFGPLPARVLSYREAFATHAGIDYTRASLKELRDLCPSSTWSRETCLHYLLTHTIEPLLGRGELTVLAYYPPTEAALACVVEKDGEPVAERFEVYHEGVELTNGYHELANSSELRKRFQEENEVRKTTGKPAYALDEPFLTSLDQLPECCGVSVGFDRAFMLSQKLDSIHKALPFSWLES
jgi:lysyl-tRNA synthetase class 2